MILRVSTAADLTNKCGFTKQAMDFTLDNGQKVHFTNKCDRRGGFIRLTHWHAQPAVRRAEPSMPLLLILALCQ
jgi:hypothetical protein